MVPLRIMYMSSIQNSEVHANAYAQTTRVMNATLPSSERNQAAKFVVHFLGDIHQPLHDENLDRGGNSIDVLFDGKPNNLHAIWDTAMPEQLQGSYSLPHAKNWSAILAREITSGVYSSQATEWLTDMDIGSVMQIEDSALAWAQQSNAFVCTTVMPEGPEAYVGKELNGTYYESCVPVIQLQIARAGYR